MYGLSTARQMCPHGPNFCILYWGGLEVMSFTSVNLSISTLWLRLKWNINKMIMMIAIVILSYGGPLRSIQQSSVQRSARILKIMLEQSEGHVWTFLLVNSLSSGLGGPGWVARSRNALFNTKKVLLMVEAHQSLTIEERKHLLKPLTGLTNRRFILQCTPAASTYFFSQE